MTKPKFSQTESLAKAPAPQAKPVIQDSDLNFRPSESGQRSIEEAAIHAVLEELDYVKHKEKNTKVSLQAQVSKPGLAVLGEKLLGILGHCQLAGHIAHFYNLRFEIEKHIKNETEFEHPKFLEAFRYLSAHPSVEAVFIYESKMIAVNRIQGKLTKTEITSSAG